MVDDALYKTDRESAKSNCMYRREAALITALVHTMALYTLLCPAQISHSVIHYYTLNAGVCIS